MLSCCQDLTRGDCPKDYPAIQGDDPSTVLMRGGSAIVRPLGDVLAGPLYNQKGIPTAEIDVAETTRGKYDSDLSPGQVLLVPKVLISRDEPLVAFTFR